jgi:hypothetical protein
MSSFATIGRIADAENASQGFKRHCALAEVAKRKPMTFQAFLKRHGKNWPTDAAPVAEDSGLQAQIAALQAQLDALTAPVAVQDEVAAPTTLVGVRFQYTRKNGTTTEREILGVNADGTLRVMNLEYGVESKRPWRGFERQLAKGSVVTL